MDFIAQSYFAACVDTKDRIVFIDEGFIHRGASAFMSKRQEQGLGKYLDAVPTSDVLVMVDISPELAISRAALRKKGLPKSFRGKNEGATLQIMTEFLDVLNHCKEQQRSAGATIIELDGSHDLAANSLKLEKQLTLAQQ
ncbi:MAG: hypothetical protein KAT26_02855 [Marinosulfonomonas sp.]|nr:hypothetical protein [Marinosulfonomonas sp.]